MHAAPFLALAGVATLALATPAYAEPRRAVDVRAVAECGAPARELEPRLERALGDGLRAELVASVAIDASPSGYRVTIETRDETNERRTKIVTAPSCDEAVDAAVVVLALAFGERLEPKTARAAPPVLASAPPVSPSDVPPAPVSEPPFVAPPPPARVDRGPRHENADSVETESSTRVGIATGGDLGTLSEPTATLALAVGRSFSALELRAAGRYGLRTVHETVETGFAESVASDFGALELGACYGTTGALRVSACMGAEAGAVRVVRRARDESGGDVDEDGVSPRLSGTFGALFAHRGAFIEPELEFSGVAVALGRNETASPFALRVAAGAAVAF